MEDIFNTELGKKIMALTKASFKVSDLIPDLFLREKIKSQILNVYKNFFEKKYSHTFELNKGCKISCICMCKSRYIPRRIIKK